MGVQDYKGTAALNVAVAGINIAEGWTPGNVNDAIRQMMADIANMFKGDGPFLLAESYGVKADGDNATPANRTDNTAALQAAIDDAYAKGRTLILPRGVIGVKGTLSMKNKYCGLKGAAPTPNGGTIIRALSAIAGPIIDARGTEDVIFSPLSIADITLDCANLATHGIMLQYHHRTVFNNVLVLTPTQVGIWEKDAWLNRRYNCAMIGGPIALHLAGANHSSLWLACSFIGCSDRHVVIENNGTALEGGNTALNFVCCDVEFGAAGGKGIENNFGYPKFTGCYLGEDIFAEVIVNKGGTVEVDGGVMFVGKTAATVLCRPIAGETIIRGCPINGQAVGGIGTFATNTPAEIAAGTGVLVVDNVKANVTTGGVPIIPGDPFGFAPGRKLCPTLGVAYTGAMNDGSFSTAIPADDPSARTVTCTAAGTSAPLLAMFGTLDPDFIRGKAVGLLVAYKSTKDLQAVLAAGLFGSNYSLTSLPASPNKQTVLKFDPIPAAGIAFSVMQFFMPGTVVNDTFTIYKVALIDAAGQRLVGSPTAAVGRVAYPA